MFEKYVGQAVFFRTKGSISYDVVQVLGVTENGIISVLELEPVIYLGHGIQWVSSGSIRHYDLSDIEIREKK